MRRHKRRGAILLLVLSLLVLLTVVGVTFVIVSGQYRRAARASLRNASDSTGTLHSEPASELFEESVMQLVSDTNNPQSALRFHSFLRDMYGWQAIVGRVSSVQPTAGGALIEIGIQVVAPQSIPPSALGILSTAFEGQLGGRLITFYTGPMRLTTMRVVDFDKGTATLRLAPLSGAATGLLPLQGDSFVINDGPFDGTGAGYNPQNDGDPEVLDQIVYIDSAGNIRARRPGQPAPAGMPVEAALVINWRGVRWTDPAGGPVLPGAPINPTGAGRPINPAITAYLRGGLDEDYDAPDFQNVALGAEFPAGGNNVINLPSFHRPALVRHIIPRIQQAMTNAGLNPAAVLYPFGPDDAPGTPDDPPATDRQVAANLLRPFIMRPLPHDHPDFPGNAAFLASLRSGSLGNYWDVDNNGDGIPDSVWVDIGLPVRYDRLGRLYKPLFAYKVIDLDGKLNLNVHGTLAHLFGYGTPNQVVVAGGINSAGIPAGLGLGPAEISLARVLGPLYGPVMQARYGIDGVPGVAVAAGRYDPLSYWKFFRYPLPPGGNSNYYHPAVTLSSFSSPFDLRGEFASGVSELGGKIGERYGPGVTNTTGDSPYELNVVDRGESATLSLGDDAPFTPAELERLLRNNDVDAAALPDRLENLLAVPFASDSRRRRMLTTLSFDIPGRSLMGRVVSQFPQPQPPPVPPWQPPWWVPPSSWEFPSQAPYREPQNRGLIGLLRQRVWQEMLNQYGAAWSNLGRQEKELVIDTIVLGFDGPLSSLPASVQPFANVGFGLTSPMMFRGLPFDVNLPFGDGRDNNGNGTVDEVAVIPAQQLESRLNVIAGQIPDLDQDGVQDNAAGDYSARLVRQRYARQLYVMALLIVGNRQIDFDGDGNSSLNETKYGLAQWAINVVDYRDADSIMTPFEFDLNPFNGWDVNHFPDPTASNPGMAPWDIPPDDNNRLNERAIVWGMERPELLVTESLAFHDLRLEDLGADAEGRIGNMAPDQDDDLDQRLRPRGFAYVELYNPWTGDERPAAELYRYNAGVPQGVDLTRRAPGNAPVWRLVFRKIYNNAPTRSMDPWGWDPAIPPNQPRPRLGVWRSIYFVPPGTLPGPLAAVSGEIFYPAVNGNWVLPGGRYAVIGSSGQDVDRNNGPLDLDGDGNRDYIGPVGRSSAGAPTDYTTTRCVVLEPADNWATVTNNAYNEPAQREIQPILAVPVTFPNTNPDRPKRWFNISEPIGGYPQDNFIVGNVGPNGERWDPAAENYEGAWTLPFDTPFDLNSDLWQINTTNNGVAFYARVYLQRLANPLEPWHEVPGDARFSQNPYITVDSFDIPLHVFNGVSNDQNRNGTEPSDPNRFVSQQRGDRNPNALAGQDTTLWFHDVLAGVNPYPADVTPAMPPGGFRPGPYFNRMLRHSLGYLNTPYEAAYGRFVPPPPPAAAPQPNSGFPQTPFPHLPWANRPFVSARELMLVPYTAQIQFPRRYAYQRNVTYSAAGLPSVEMLAPFGHLINFYATSDGTNQAADLYRLFDFLYVPSRFTGTETWLNPTRFNVAAGVNGTAGYTVPYNYVSRFRDPGKVNLNTIFHQDVFQSLFQSRGSTTFPGPSWAQFRTSRRGSAAPGLAYDPQIPTLFGNPFRSPAGRFVPRGNMVRRRDIDTTLMRQTAPQPSANSQPLFDRYPSDLARNGRRHAFYRYQSLVRLENLTTTRSNVYAVWVTMGRFAVDPVAVSNAHPDGYQLGMELDTDRENAKRRRAFYLIDRTRPVGFAPGKRLNADQCIILRRQIE